MTPNRQGSAGVQPSTGFRLTASRREVLEILRQRAVPLSAYELLAALVQARGHKMHPPTVYRALEALRAQGLVARIESRNGFVARSGAGSEAGLFYLCVKCGVAQEVADADVEDRVSRDAEHLHFKVSRQVHEVEGTCGECQRTPGDGLPNLDHPRRNKE